MRPLHLENHDIWIRLAGILVIVCAVGCSSSTGATAGHCYAPAGPHATVVECAQTQLCLPAQDTKVVNSATTCAGQPCAWALDAPGRDEIDLRGGDTHIYLKFSAAIGSVQTTEDLARIFDSVWFERDFPVNGGPATAKAQDERSGLGAFDVFEYANGTLRVKLSFMVQDPYADVSSQAPECRTSDVPTCQCTYSGVHVPATIDVTLPLQT